MNPEGVITRQSKYSVKETIDRLQGFLKQHGATLYARIDQQAEVQKTGLNIAPLEYLLFGNPKAGGVLMTQNPLIALDLPLKIIAWEDAQKKVWISYNHGSYLEKRYGLPPTENSPVYLDPLISKALDL